MIKNELEYRITKSAIKKFRGTLQNTNEATKSLEPWARKTYQASIEGQISELQTQIEEYEALKGGNVTTPRLTFIESIPKLLVRRRIELGWTQEELAKKLRLKPQQIQNYEATDYLSASLRRITEVARVLDKGRRKANSMPGTSLATKTKRGRPIIVSR